MPFFSTDMLHDVLEFLRPMQFSIDTLHDVKSARSALVLLCSLNAWKAGLDASKIRHVSRLQCLPCFCPAGPQTHVLHTHTHTNELYILLLCCRQTLHRKQPWPVKGGHLKGAAASAPPCPLSLSLMSKQRQKGRRQMTAGSAPCSASVAAPAHHSR